MNKKQISNKIIGIDLGTTNSCVAYVPEGSTKPEIIHNFEGERITPSVVLLKNGEIIVGKLAKELAMTSPNYVSLSPKRLVGSGKKIKLGSKEYTVQEVQAMILNKLITDATNFLGETVKKVVVTVPAYYTDAQRQSVKETIKISGAESVRIINEPTAALMAYKMNNANRSLSNNEDSNVLVFDLGGGTFDVSIINCQYDKKEGGMFKVLSTFGDNHLGGDDFDKLIQDMCIENFKKKHGLDFSNDVSAKQKVIIKSEAI